MNYFSVFLKDYIFYNATTKLLDPVNGEQYSSLPLCRVTDPEIKRKIIGDTFMTVIK